jgi:hypothetical protein
VRWREGEEGKERCKGKPGRNRHIKEVRHLRRLVKKKAKKT